MTVQRRNTLRRSLRIGDRFKRNSNSDIITITNIHRKDKVIEIVTEYGRDQLTFQSIREFYTKL